MEIKVFKEVWNGATATVQFQDIIPFSSAVWEEKLPTIGACQIVFPATDEVLALMKSGVYVLFDKTCGINDSLMYYIHSVSVAADQITAYGFEVKWLWRKAVKTGAIKSRNVSAATAAAAEFSASHIRCKGAVSMSLTNDANVSSLELYEDESIADVYTYAQRCLDAAYSGVKATYNAATKKIDISCYDPADKSSLYNFARHLGNMKGDTYTLSNQDEYNEVTVIGTNLSDQEVTMRVTLGSITADYTNWERFSKNLKVSKQGDNQSSADYTNYLAFVGILAIKQSRPKVGVAIGSIDLSDYGGDGWKIGDYVGVMIDALKKRYKAQAIGARYVCENNHTSVTVSFDILNEITE